MGSDEAVGILQNILYEKNNSNTSLGELARSQSNNFDAAVGLLKPSFAGDIISMFSAMQKNGSILIHKDLDSALTPTRAMGRQFGEIRSALDNANHLGIRLLFSETYTPDKQGHAVHENPWAWATIIRAALEEQKAVIVSEQE